MTETTRMDALWRYLYKHHRELEEFHDMTDESFMTEADIICKELEEAREALEERDSALAEKDALIAELQKELANLKGK